jgi:hypothetical protein
VNEPARHHRGALLLGIAVLAGAGCQIFSLDGLTGGAGTDAGSSAIAPGATDAAAAEGDPRGDASIAVDASAAEDAWPDVAPRAEEPEGSAEASPPSCGPDGGWIVCDGACVDPTSDPTNCNGCGNLCPTGSCGAVLSESLATEPTAWAFNGSATYNAYAPSAELTPVATYQAGTFVYEDPIVVDAFDVTFSFRLGLDGGSRADGIGFMIEQSGPSAVGGVGSGLGMAALTGYGVEFDIFDNEGCGDTNDDHVGVDELGACEGGALPSPVIATGPLAIDLGDVHWHQAYVRLAAGAISATVDGTLVVENAVLPGFEPGQPYYFGFAGATGGLSAPDGGSGGYRQEVKDVVLTFPTPRCL